MASKVEILRGAWKKLDSMSLSFGMKDILSDEELDKNFGGDLKDCLRELGLQSVDSVQEMSDAELQIENRVVYYALRRFRNSSSVFFKFSTATDGKSVDKSMIPKMIMQIMQEYDTEFKKWRMKNTGSLWIRSET